MKTLWNSWGWRMKSMGKLGMKNEGSEGIDGGDE